MESMRKAFEEVTYPTLQLAGTYTAHGLRRRHDTGEYVSDMLEDHWQTFQEGWEAGIEYFKKSLSEY
jgi:hypothetical protein